MCGPDNSGRPRGGALAVLLPTQTALDQCTGLNADLSFFSPSSQRSSEATHIQLTIANDASQSETDELFVMVQYSASECGLMCTIPLQKSGNSSTRTHAEIELPEPLSLTVGGDGIIGRRVSLCCRDDLDEKTIVAEGIVGYNFSDQVQASL
ncbi:uncharacterized protein F5Z01DRAFT_675435 [Emericellopsis atlantica]|uniref:Uncharacterized protein n=1 Tax=Emericellopsis atlantica TaxID=2614577 RepID=A0A9P7ZJ87_9HYPO|nr:uncharacterized protein F5Z01DRAFT_675435 [Emericellopsis atlantica]KAG9253030.1 hypothetical protein F5Z01DRAFT_675435 [Emericellopsis atlantica]